MSLLLLLVTEEGGPGGGSPSWTPGIEPKPWLIDIHIGAEEPLGMPPPGMPLGLQPLRNEYVRVVEDFNITYTLHNRAVMTCRTVDPREDLPNAYRPVTNQRVVVLTKDGEATVFSGRIANVRETSMEPNARTGTTLLVDIIDDQEIFEYTWVTRPFGTAGVEIVIAEAGANAIIHAGGHGLAAGSIVTIENVGGAAAVINGTRAVTAVLDGNRFTIPVALGTTVHSPGGTARGRVYLRDAIDAVLSETGLTSRGIVRDPGMDLGPLMEFYNFDTTVSEVFKSLFGAAEWVYRLLPEKILQAFPPGTKTTTFEFNQDTCLGAPEIIKNRSGFANTVRVTYGSNAQVVKLDMFSADGVTRRWPLSYRASMTAEGVFPGNVGGGVPYFIPVAYTPGDVTNEWMIDLSTQELVHNTAFPAVPAGVTIHLGYHVQFPQVVEVIDQDLVDEQGGKWIKRIERPDIYEANTAIDQGEVELAKVKLQPRKVSFSTRGELVMPGTTIPVYFPDRLMTDDTALWMVYSVSITEDEDGLFRYRYTIQEDNQYHPGWIEFFKDMARGSDTSTIATSSTIPPSSGSGLTGVGTVGALAKWATSTALTDAANIAEIVGGIRLNGFLRGNMGGAYDFQLQNIGGLPVFQVPTGTQNLQMVGGITTAAFTDLNLLPSGSVVFNPGSKLLLPQFAYDVNIGMLTKKFLTLHAAELWVETLVAQNTIATIGGRVLVGPTNILSQDFPIGSGTIVMKYTNMVVGDIVYMEANGKIEFMQITYGPVDFGGGIVHYLVTRDLDGTGQNDWYAGDAVFNTGQPGNGFIDLYSVRGIKAGTEIGPTIVGNRRFGYGFNDWETIWAIGNLNGLHGHGAGITGALFGVRNGAWTRIDNVYGFVLHYINTIHVHIDMSGNSYFAGYMVVNGGITTGSITLNGGAILSNGFNWGVTPGFYLGWNGAAYVFLIGNGSSRYMVWDGTNLYVRAHVINFGAVTMDDNGLQIPLNSSGSSAKLVIGNVVIDASSFGNVFIGGGVSVQYLNATGDIYSLSSIEAQNELECHGYLKCHSNVEWYSTNLYWNGTPNTTANDYPLVHSPGNGNVYQKTNGYDGTIFLSGISGIVVERGIVTGAV